MRRQADQLLRPAINIDARLENWGDVLRWRRRAGLANTIYGWGKTSGRFSAAQGAPSSRPVLDPSDAWLLEQAVRAIPLFQHLLLKLWYVRKDKQEVCLRRAAKGSGTSSRRPTVAHWTDTLTEAQGRVVEALGLPAVVRNERALRIAEAVLWQEYEHAEDFTKTSCVP